ncbi:MAG: efflux RND transporter periplasmic adaptor subunit [Planctomycetota bacterium]|jgi:hypothetical protein
MKTNTSMNLSGNTGRRCGAIALLALGHFLGMTGCTDPDEPAVSGGGAADGATTRAPTNRVEIPSVVRRNLGLTFVTVERRQVARTLRVPGRFELLPTARREYRTMLPGRVELLVDQFETIAAGQPLYRIDSPKWRDMQQQLSEAEAAIGRLETKVETFTPRLAAHQAHQENLRQSEVVWEERVAQLESVRDAGGGRLSELAEARAAQATASAERSESHEKEAELDADFAETQAELQAARTRREFRLQSAAAILQTTVDALTSVDSTQSMAQPMWRSIEQIVVRAETDGTIESLGLTNGAWADEKSAVLTIVQPNDVRFHASGLQSDLGVLRDGLPARIVPPTPTKAGRAIDLQDTMSGTLALGLTGDPDERTVDMYVAPDRLARWARPGVAALLEIVTDATASAELAIPLAAVQTDGLMPIIFRRDPKNPDEAIRLEADLGLDDGRWVVLQSGVRDGDEIVLDGAFQLMLAMSGSIQKGGHFHADGTFHEGEH